MPTMTDTGMGNCLQVGKPPQHFNTPPRPTQPPVLAGWKISTSQSVATLCSRGLKASMVHCTCG